jgi:hypothetical protein
MSLTSDVRPGRKLAAAGGAAVLLLALSACGSGDKDSPSATGYQDGPQNQQAGPGTDQRMPGANGKVAAVAGSTAQVQGMDGQVAVSWNGSTTFTKDVAGSLADIEVGSCVLVAPSGDSGSSSTPATTVTAANVRITAKVNGSCGVGLHGPDGGQAGSGPQLNGTPPSGAPDGRRPRVRSLGGAIGEVTAVTSDGFTLDSVLPGSDDKKAITVTVSGDTTYTKTAAGAAADVKVGVCVTASGDTDDTGAVTATTIAVSQPVGGACGGPMRFTSGDGAPSTQGS